MVCVVFVKAYMVISEDNLYQLVSSYRGRPGDQSQTGMCGGNCLYQLSHLVSHLTFIDPSFFI